MDKPTCRYPTGDVPIDPDSVDGRLVTVTFDPEDSISILRALRETCCPSTLEIVAVAVTNA